LEREAEECESYFLRKGIELIVDGTEPKSVKNILQKLALADGAGGAQMLNRLIMAEGVLAIQRGENPRMIINHLAAMLGEKYLQRATEQYDCDINQKFRQLSWERAAWTENPEFEEELSSYRRHDISYIVKRAGVSTTAMALCGCSSKLINCVLHDAVSEKIFMEICLKINEFETEPKENLLPRVQDARARVVGCIKKLLEECMILKFDSNGKIVRSVNTKE